MDRGGLQVRVATGTSLPALLLCAVLTWGLALPARAASVDFLYVESSGGTAGGGHFGVQLGGDVYHFQSVEGWLRLQRWDADFFRYAYSVRENRTIHVARVEIDDQTARALGRRFDRRHGVGRKHESIRESLVRDRQLLEHLSTPEASRTSEGLPFRLRGAGLFEPRAPDPALRRLRARVEERYGARHLERSIEALRARILAMQPYAAPAGPWALSRDEAPGTPYRFSERFSDVTLELLALEALHGGTLRPQLLRELPAPAARLDPAEIQALARYSDDLEDRLLALIDSRRPDRGMAVLLGMARLVALRATLDSGRLTVIDAFPSDAPEIDSGAVERSRIFFEELLAHEARELRRSRAGLATGAPVEEPGYQRLEEATNRFLELDGALAGGRLRLSGRRLLPEGPVRQGSWLLPQAEGVNLLELVEGARGAELAYGSAAARVYAYDLWTHNCVTEVFRTLEAELPGAESERRLGGRVDPAGFLHFVPAVGYQAVLDRYRVSEIGEIPSFRRTRLEAMAARDGRLRTRLRESNTLSSSLYRGGEGDSAFLFFTEDPLWLRPLYGAFNLLTGVGQMTWGLVSAPFDGGAELTAGAEGVVFSVPELVFVNLRKGSMAYAPSEQPRTSLRVLETP